MGINFTPSQEAAVKAKGSVFVSAAAGSGKTAVLSSRVVSLLTDRSDPVSADRLLVVTFTNDAAAEMRARIEKKLNEECLKNPHDKLLLRQKYLLPSADICTIDSFCINLIRDNFELCGISPDFKVSSGESLSEERSAVLRSIFEDRLIKNEPAFKMLLNIADCEYDEKNLLGYVLAVYEKGQNMPSPEAFYNSLKEPYTMAFDKEHIWQKIMFKKAKRLAADLKRSVMQAANAGSFLQVNREAVLKDCETLSLLADDISDLINSEDWDKIYSLMRSSEIPRIKSGDKTDTNYIDYKDFREEYKKCNTELKSIFNKSSSDIENDLKKSLPAVSMFVDIVKEFSDKFFEVCLEKNELTFSMTEQMALHLLAEVKDGKFVPTAVSEKIISRYSEVLVDEFQDVNDLQDMLFDILSDHGKKLFAVGDVKQSIYGFRGSNPKNFIRRKNACVPYADIKSDKPQKIILSENFRSREEVCNFINFSFSKLMDGRIGDIVYNEEEMLKCSGSFCPSLNNSTDILLCDANSDDTSESPEKPGLEAEAVADYIEELIKSGFKVSSDTGERNVTYEDIAILLPALKNKADYFADELNRRNIPVNYGSEEFFETFEISVFISLLKIIDNPKSDIDLLAVMLSPMFGFSSEEAALIRAEFKKSSFYSAVVYASENGNEKCAKFLKSISDMRLKATVLPCDELAYECMQATDFLSVCSGLAGGERKRANLNTLLTVISDICSDSSSDLNSVLKRLKSSDNIKTVFTGEGGVTIKTFHGSKGLQYPVCILANLGTQFNEIDIRQNIIFDENCGMGISFFDYGVDEKVKNIGYDAISEYKKLKNIEEKMRLLYVGMTRAEEKLVLSFASSSMEKTLNKIAASIDPDKLEICDRVLFKSNNMMNWIAACALMTNDSKDLKKFYGIENFAGCKDLRINLKICTNLNRKADGKSLEEIIAPDIKTVQKLKENFDYKYPYKGLTSLRSKASVSLLANKAEADSFAFCAKPSFMKSGNSGAARGTAMHKVMQFIDFNSADLDKELERLYERKYISEEELKLINKGNLEKFLSSALAQRIKNAKDLKREMRFLCRVEAGAFDQKLSQTEKKEPVIIQGAIDLCFIENGEIVIVDFKTDYVKSKEELAERYKEQLEIYSFAAKKILNANVKERILYSFCLGEEIKSGFRNF